MDNWEYAWERDKDETLRTSYEDMAREAYRLGYGAGHDDGYDEAEEYCCDKC